MNSTQCSVMVARGIHTPQVLFDSDICDNKHSQNHAKGKVGK